MALMKIVKLVEGVYGDEVCCKGNLLFHLMRDSDFETICTGMKLIVVNWKPYTHLPLKR